MGVKDFNDYLRALISATKQREGYFLSTLGKGTFNVSNNKCKLNVIPISHYGETIDPLVYGLYWERVFTYTHTHRESLLNFSAMALGKSTVSGFEIYSPNMFSFCFRLEKNLAQF